VASVVSKRNSIPAGAGMTESLPSPARSPLHCKPVTSCFSSKHFDLETTKDTKSTKKRTKEARPRGWPTKFSSCLPRTFVSFVLFVVSALWLRPKAAPSPLASSAVSYPGSLRVKTCVPGDSQRSQISGRNVGFYATYRCRKASIYGSAAGGGQRQSSTTNHATPMKGMGILGQRQSSTTNHANPTKGIGILWSPLRRVSSWKSQVSS
jgi:hypothetical protein